MSAAATAWIVAREGEIWPFSIFETMPTERPEAPARSLIDRSRSRRSVRTCKPSARSSVRVGSVAGALDTVVSSAVSEAWGNARFGFRIDDIGSRLGDADPTVTSVGSRSATKNDTRRIAARDAPSPARFDRGNTFSLTPY